MELKHLLERLAYRIDADGTVTEARTLTVLAEAIRQLARGAADALVDWRGSEVARQRAFGIAHRVALDELDEDARARLQHRIEHRDMVLYRLDPMSATHLIRGA